MIKNKVNDTEYEILLYDWITKHDDYMAGTVKRNPNADDESDERYWMFFPNGNTTAINAGQLNRLSIFIRELNSELDC